MCSDVFESWYNNRHIAQVYNLLGYSKFCVRYCTFTFRWFFVSPIGNIDNSWSGDNKSHNTVDDINWYLTYIPVFKVSVLCQGLVISIFTISYLITREKQQISTLLSVNKPTKSNCLMIMHSEENYQWDTHTSYHFVWWYLLCEYWLYLLSPCIQVLKNPSRINTF